MSRLIALDAGHGLFTAGKRTKIIPELGRHIVEHEFNRAIVDLMKPDLERHGFRVLLTAPNPKLDTALSTRVNVANKYKADIFVSVHYNAGGGIGLETFYHRYSTKGRHLAQLVHKRLIATKLRKDRGIKTQNFYVLRETKMPAVLIEYGFMDDPQMKEAREMLNRHVQKQFAIATTKGICEYFGVVYKEDKPVVAKPTIPSVMYDVGEVIDGVRKGIRSTRHWNEIEPVLKNLWAEGKEVYIIPRKS